MPLHEFLRNHACLSWSTRPHHYAAMPIVGHMPSCPKSDTYGGRSVLSGLRPSLSRNSDAQGCLTATFPAGTRDQENGVVTEWSFTASTSRHASTFAPFDRVSRCLQALTAAIQQLHINLTSAGSRSGLGKAGPGWGNCRAGASKSSFSFIKDTPSFHFIEFHTYNSTCIFQSNNTHGIWIQTHEDLNTNWAAFVCVRA